MKLGLTQIQIEEEKLMFTFLFACLFLTDFVSYWFQVYSSYLLDQESHKTSNTLIQGFLYFLKNPLVSFTMTFLAEAYTFSYYMKFFPKEFSFVHSHPLYSTFMQVALGGAILKIVHNLLHIWVSSLRIVGLDVENKNNPKPVNANEKAKA